MEKYKFIYQLKFIINHLLLLFIIYSLNWAIDSFISIIIGALIFFIILISFSYFSIKPLILEFYYYPIILNYSNSIYNYSNDFILLPRLQSPQFTDLGKHSWHIIYVLWI